MKPDESKSMKAGARLPQFDSSADPAGAPPAAAGKTRASRSRSGRAASADFEALSAELEKLTNPDGSPRPNPVELPSPINPEGGRKQSVETHRNLFCGHYDSCLDEAVKNGWNSFTCVRCSFYQSTPAEAEGGVDRFATQRKIS